MTARGVGVGYGRAVRRFRESPKLSSDAIQCHMMPSGAALSIV
jgi:hypothetical protein